MAIRGNPVAVAAARILLLETDLDEEPFELARTDEQVKMLHIIAHGSVGESTSWIVLTVLSCCQLGTDHDLMHRVLETSGAAALFSYAGGLDDWQDAPERN